MNKIDRYVGRNLLHAWVLTLAMMAVVFGIFAFIDELDNTGQNYSLADALLFVTFTTPLRTLELVPLALMLGTIFALSSMARRNEIAAIRCTGMTELRFLGSVALPALGLMLLLWPASEYLAVPLQQYAEASREQARSGQAFKLKQSGLWASDGRNFHHVGRLDSSLMPGDIDIYEFSAQGRLLRAIHADQGTIGTDRNWQLENVVLKTHSPEPDSKARMTSQHAATLHQRGLWSAGQLANQMLMPSSLSLRELHDRLGGVNVLGTSAEKIEYLLWQRTLLPVLALVMVLLGYQLSAGMTNPGERSLGTQLAIGVAVSLVFYISSQIIHATGLILELNALLVASGPPLLAVAVTMALHHYRAWEAG